MAIPEVCDRCGQFPPNALVSMLDDGTTRYLCIPCMGQVADAIIEQVTSVVAEAELEPTSVDPAPDAPLEAMGAGHGQQSPKRGKQQKQGPAADTDVAPAPETPAARGE